METSTHFLSPNDHTVVVIGYSATGKSFFADALMHMYSGYKLYRTDDYMDQGYEQALYKLMNHIRYDQMISKKLDPKIIVEGVQGYRLLRKGLEEDGRFWADVIFVMEASKATRQKRYLNRKDSIQKMRHLDAFDTGLQKIWLDYRNKIENLKERPRIVVINTDGTSPYYRTEV